MRMLTLPLLLCALMLLSRTTETNGWTMFCQHGWTQINTRCFKYVSTRLNWAQAESNCKALGGHLASVHSSTEYYAIQALIKSASYKSKKTWIGGSDTAQEGVWSWTDGTKMTYLNWCPREPKYGRKGLRQNCMQMNHSARKCWDDTRCWIRKPSVCVMGQ